ncbi:MAG: type VI secretion system lipoprotein TssJ [Myxococcota bacterium]
MPAHRHPVLLAARIFLIALGLVGCGRDDALFVRAVDPLNCSPDGETTTVDIRIYQLRRQGSFLAADFTSLWLDDDAALAGDQLGDPKAVTIRPGDGAERPRRIAVGPWQEGALYVGIMALYPQSPAEGARRTVLSAFDLEDHVSVLGDGRLEVVSR